MSEIQRGFWRRSPVFIAVVFIAGLWSVPTVGLLISSFRSSEAIATSGWWTVFAHPFEETWTLINYSNVLTADNMFNAFVNSLIVTIPATVIPITIAAA